jgi:predicted ribosome quality control (RQC) complex YloA/Tae2 family protein
VRKEIEKYLTAEIESLSGKLNKLKGRIDAGSKEEIYHQYGEILLANNNIIRKGMKEIELEEYTSGQFHRIKLNEKLSPHQNIDRYFDKSRSEKIEYQKSKELFGLNTGEYERLMKIRDKFERTEDQELLLQIKKELKMKTQQSLSDDTKDKSLYRHFLMDGKYHIYVGKNSKNNDMLTTKFAKQNDFWFHARSVSGSHVVLRVENTKEAVPKNILQKTASLAAFYSKAKTSKLVPVTYTLKKYVNKNARHEPGQVTVTKETVLLVKPEIPKGCEMVMD